MKTFIWILTANFLVFMGSAQENTSEQIYWVNGIKVSCSGVAPMQCLLVQKGENWVPGEWQHFYSSIDGFVFQYVYIYKLLVHEEENESEKIPADASSIKYTLIKVLEKIPDPKFRINDIWVLETLQKEIIGNITENEDSETPAIEIHLSEMRIMGTDGCNRFQGQIINIEEDKIDIGPLAGTMRLCPNMEISDKFNLVLQQVKKYKVENLKLYFLDESGNELLQFKKID